MDGLLKISGCDNPNAIGDVVFIHGLDGDARETWQPKGQPSAFWPAWLGEEFENMAVWSLGYEVSATAWKGNAMPLVDRATHVLTMLQTQELGQRPIVFICHSLGGLLVKQMLRHAGDFGDPTWKAIQEQTRGIVFLSTPHSGANIASWLKYIGTLLRTTVSVEELEAHHPRLRELNTWYRNYDASSQKIKTLVFCEKEKIAGLLVVDETTADPGIPGVNPVPMDDNHVSICKPVSKETMLYQRTRQFITERIGNP